MSHLFTARPRLTLIPATLALLLAVGCQSQDESSNPVGGGTGGTSGVAADDIELTGLGTMEFVNQFVSEVGALSQADFSNVTFDLGFTQAIEAPRTPTGATLRSNPSGGLRTAEEIVWTEELQSWVLDVEETETTEEGVATLALHFAVQYRSGSTPQQWPDETTTSMTLEAAFALNLDGESEGQVFTMDFDYDTSMTVGGLQSQEYTIDGEGAMDVAMHWNDTTSADNLNLTLGMDWLMDLSVPVEACPSGLVTVNANTPGADNYSFVGTYDGTPNYDWTVYDNGVAVDSGSEVLDCAVPTS